MRSINCWPCKLSPLVYLESRLVPVISNSNVLNSSELKTGNSVWLILFLNVRYHYLDVLIKIAFAIEQVPMFFSNSFNNAGQTNEVLSWPGSTTILPKLIIGFVVLPTPTLFSIAKWTRNLAHRLALVILWSIAYPPKSKN